MSALLGWGFTAQALERHLRRAAPEPTPKNASKSCYVKPEEFEAYAATLDHTPTPAEVQEHFKCKRPSAYNYRRKIVAILARRAKEGR